MERPTPKRSITKPQVGKFNFGDLGLLPVCSRWGFSRGHPIDRYYIEKFLARRAPDIQGHVLEIGDNIYTQKFGGERVIKSDVMDLTKSKHVTIIGDLTYSPHISSNTFDCIILTQVLIFIRDVSKALINIRRILKPGGVVLITVPGITHISSFAEEEQHWFWSFYPKTLKWLLSRSGFDDQKVIVEEAGNLKATAGFLIGLAREDLQETELEFYDKRYPLIVTGRAVK